MAKNFGSAGSAKAFGNTKKTEQEKAQVIALQNIRSSNLLDYPKNGEDISFTADLEESMRQNGYTDPMEVTDFGMEDGKYMILSGHRRRAAGVKVFGDDFAFPCVIRHFKTDEEVQNYVLMANSQRDSAKDPCLFCGRYKMHEEYLESINFNGNKREEIAKRLGISVQQADRYNAMNKIIFPVWDMVRAEIVGMSSVQPMAKHSQDEQEEIYEIMQEALVKEVSLTRDTVKMIVDGYRNGKKTWAEIENKSHDSGIPLNVLMNTEPGETKESSDGGRRDEIHHEYDPIAEEYDKMDEAQKEWEEAQETDLDDGTSDDANEPEKHQLTEEEKQIKRGTEIAKQLGKLDNNLKEFYKCENNEAALDLFNNMKSVTLALIDEMYRVGTEYELNKEFKNALESVIDSMDAYRE